MIEHLNFEILLFDKKEINFLFKIIKNLLASVQQGSDENMFDKVEQDVEQLTR
jgi:hypothetical protein